MNHSTHRISLDLRLLSATSNRAVFFHISGALAVSPYSLRGTVVCDFLKAQEDYSIASRLPHACEIFPGSWTKDIVAGPFSCVHFICLKAVESLWAVDCSPSYFRMGTLQALILTTSIILFFHLVRSSSQFLFPYCSV